MSNNVVTLLQESVSPAIIISGVSLFLLVLTNRLGRVVDRARALRHEIKELRAVNEHSSDVEEVAQQMHILLRRARYLQAAILLSTCSTLFCGVVILSVFITLLFSIERGVVVQMFWALSLTSLIGGKIMFLVDTGFSLSAFRHELKRAGNF